MTPQQRHLSDEKSSKFERYKDFSVGKSASFKEFFLYELIYSIFSAIPGGIGFAARGCLYRYIFNRMESGCAIGRGVSLRGTKKISLAKNILIDDYAALEARGEQAKIELAEHVTIGRLTTIVSKDGDIKLAPSVNIGSYCRIATQSKIEIGPSTLIAAYTYVGPGNHQRDKEGDKPLISQAMEIKGGVKIGSNCWIGAHTTIMDGVIIGDGAIIGAHSFIKEDVPSGATVFGVPGQIRSK
jgi:carbonic anhydrase/acetyltransferase-like protein (isoleucine patch superfamily)